MREIIKNSKSLREVSLCYFGYCNIKTYGKINEYIKINNVDISHFPVNPSNVLRIKYPRIIKKCPVCEKEFETRLGSKSEKTVCSHSCSNTYYRTGISHPNRKTDDELVGITSYTIICFRHHIKKCVCCNEENIVEAHHYDGNKKNNKPENLVPLCPTHHRYWHSRFRYLIRDVVDSYVINFKNK